MVHILGLPLCNIDAVVILKQNLTKLKSFIPASSETHRAYDEMRPTYMCVCESMTSNYAESGNA